MVCPGTFHKWSRGLGVTGTVIDRCLGVGVGPLGSACSGWCVGEDWGGLGRTGEEAPPIPLLRPFDSAQGERNAPPQGMVEAGMGSGEEARVGCRAVPYRPGSTGPMKACVTHGTP